MRFSISAIFAFATSFALVAAQDLSGIPSCAIPCFLPAVQGSGCSLTDARCQCTTGRESITNSLFTCTPSRCSASDIANIASAVQALCANAGVTLTNIPSVVPSSLMSAATSGVTGTAVRSASATGSAAPAATTNAAAGNVVGYGAAVAMGLVGVLAL
ncbi:hypothetical protein CC86DRAFT_368923 [Ophiobolus disseminans]|uniref:CFEM domain-containing protein n=1 Tax=Ophiobolus disseminans TaxID=1469910 RepID=A0A6A7A6I6_9PLEO|nr:hypothetical protein CC86DRAFT_368923 [Ophiobolus disseminans]